MGTLSSFGDPIIILNPAANRGKMDKYRTLILERDANKLSMLKPQSKVRQKKLQWWQPVKVAR